MEQGKAIRDQIAADGEVPDHPLLYVMTNILDKYMETDPGATIEKARAACAVAEGKSKTLHELIDE